MSEPIPLESITVRSEWIGAEPDVILKGSIHTITTCWSDVREIGEQVGPNGEVLDRGGRHDAPETVEFRGPVGRCAVRILLRIRISLSNGQDPISVDIVAILIRVEFRIRGIQWIESIADVDLGQLIVASIETAHRHLEPIG